MLNQHTKVMLYNVYIVQSLDFAFDLQFRTPGIVWKTQCCKVLTFLIFSSKNAVFIASPMKEFHSKDSQNALWFLKLLKYSANSLKFFISKIASQFEAVKFRGINPEHVAAEDRSWTNFLFFLYENIPLCLNFNYLGSKCTVDIGANLNSYFIGACMYSCAN